VTHWSSRRLADWLHRARGISVSHDSISVLWRKFCLQPHCTEGFEFSTDPQGLVPRACRGRPGALLVKCQCMIVILGGVSGSGKSTGPACSTSGLGLAFEDGDVLHPAANIAKMRSGAELTDDDRWPWLRVAGTWIDQRIAAGESAGLPARRSSAPTVTCCAGGAPRYVSSS
jgi:hypothetical protein